MIRRKRDNFHHRSTREILLDVERQIQELFVAQQEMEARLNLVLANLKASIDDAVLAITMAIDRIQNAGNPTEFQAEVDRLNVAVGSLLEAINPPQP